MTTLNKILAIALSITPTFAVSILEEGFETPKVSGKYKYVQESDFINWTVVDDSNGEKSFITNEDRWGGAAGYPDLFGKQALVLNEGSGIRTTVSLIAGDTYDFSIWLYGGYGNGADIPLLVSIGSFVHNVSFDTWRSGLKEKTFSFVATETTETTLLILNPNNPEGDSHTRTIDNISLNRIPSTPVPEGGATFILLGIGLLGMFFARANAKG